MGDRQVKYEATDYLLRLEWPESWDPALVSDVNIEVKDLGGTDLLAATAMTVPTYKDTDADIDLSTPTTISLGTPTTEDDPVAGDRLAIGDQSGTAYPTEYFVVQAFNGSTDTITTRDELQYPHASGAAILPRFSTYELDVSDTDTFPLGKRMLIRYIPGDGTSPAITELAVIAKTDYQVPDFSERFARLYPYEWETVVDRIDGIYDEAMERTEALLEDRSIILDRVVNQRPFYRLVIDVAREVVLNAQGDASAGERENHVSILQKSLEMVCNRATWQDDDQDLSQESQEIDDSHSGALMCRRGF